MNNTNDEVSSLEDYLLNAIEEKQLDSIVDKMVSDWVDEAKKEQEKVTTLPLIYFASQSHLNGNQRVDTFATHCLQIT